MTFSGLDIEWMVIDNTAARLPLEAEFVARAACKAAIKAHDHLTPEMAASLDAETALRERQLSDVASQYQTLRDEIDHLTSEESIIDRAEDIGMYFPD